MEDMKSLVVKAKAGDGDAFAAIYEMTKERAYFVAARYVGADDVADVLQDSYISALRYLPNFDENEPLEPWLHTIVRSRAIDFFRRKKSMSSIDDDEFPEIEDSEAVLPDEYLEREDKRHEIMRIIDSLPDAQRLTVVMRYLEGRTNEEIAELMDCSINTVGSRLRYARKAIRDAILMEEKKGNKLYGIAPIPFLTMLFKLEMESGFYHMPDAVSTQVSSTITNSLAAGTSTAAGVAAEGTATSSAMAGGTSAGSTAAGKGIIGKIMAMSVGAKVTIAAICVVAVIAGVGMPLYLRSENQKAEQAALILRQEQEAQLRLETEMLAGSAASSASESTPALTPETEPEEHEEPAEPQFVRITADGGLRMRTGPGSDYDIITLIPQNAYAEVVEDEENSDWLYVLFEDDTGWVSKEFVVYEDIKYEAWQHAYADYLRNHEYLKQYYRWRRFFLYDIDKNGVPEIFIIASSADGFIYELCTYTESLETIKTDASHFSDWEYSMFANWLVMPSNPSMTGYFSSKMDFANTLDAGIPVDVSYNTVENGKIKAISVYRDVGGEAYEIFDKQLYDEYQNSTPSERPVYNSEELHSVNDFTIQRYIYGYDMESQHVFVKALDEYFKDAAGKTGAWLRDIDGDGVEEMIASRYDAPDGDMGEINIMHRFFYIRDGELYTYDTESVSGLAYMGYPELIFSDNDDLVLYGNGSLGYHSIFSFENGELKPDAVILEAKHYLDSPNSDYLYSGVEISKSEYDDYLRQYGLDQYDSSYLYEDAPPDETAKILALR